MNLNQINYRKLSEIVTERTSPFIFWCGAGLGMDVGLPGWYELKSNIINEFEKEANNDEMAKLKIIKQSTDLWTSFSMLLQTMEQQKYQAYIRSFLDKQTDIPEIYNALWRLNPKGIITLNLDRLAMRSFTNVSPGKTINEFNGYELSENFKLIKTPYQFIVNMHGEINNTSSWVFTRENLKRLQNKPGYREFLTAIFTSNVVVFIGVSADDVAAGGVLNSLVEGLGFDLGDHYWITDRTDSNSKEWANKSNVGVIRYNSDKHEEVIKLITGINKTKTEDPEGQIVKKNEDDNKSINISDMYTTEANKLRFSLNHTLQSITSDSDKVNYDVYFNFVDSNEEEIHRAWFVSKKLPTPFFEYTLTDQIGRGGFGKVFRAIDKEGKIYAIKIIHENVWEQREKLKCFRRGVRSLRILCTKGVLNVVTLKDAAEIPLMIVMEYIDGPNLETLIESKQCKDWSSIISISEKISKTLLTAHNLPERVLHRDLRPTNIMLKDYYSRGEYNVVLTDFDFAWHKGSTEDSISRSPAGFIAPEQVDGNTKYSTRSALVDSYGLGMNMYYMVSQNKPMFKNHKHSEWEIIVRNACLEIEKNNWLSIPLRLSRLILNLTKDNQFERWDISQAYYELSRLSILCVDGKTEYVELIAEELFFRAINSVEYEVKDSFYEYLFRNGLSLRIGFSEVDKKINIEIMFTATGSERHDSIKKYLPRKKEATLANLVKNKWRIEIENYSKESFIIKASIQSVNLLRDFNLNVTMLSELKEQFNFA